MKKRFTEERIIGFLKEAEGGVPVKDLCRKHVFGKDEGRDYIYLYPGIQKVIQAAGRVVRTPSDQGIVHLIDDRYGEPEIRSLMPKWWG